MTRSSVLFSLAFSLIGIVSTVLADENPCTTDNACRRGTLLVLPGESYSDGCNECFCDEGGLACTEIACLGCFDDNKFYNPGESFPHDDGCNECTCNETPGGDFQLNCTREPCGFCVVDGAQYPTGSNFSDGCNDCSCRDGAVACTEAACEGCTWKGVLYEDGACFPDGNNECQCDVDAGGVACTGFANVNATDDNATDGTVFLNTSFPSSSPTPGPDTDEGGCALIELRILEDERQRWEATGIISYDYVLDQLCFCFPPGPLALEVRDCAVDSITVLLDGFEGADATNRAYTIDELFVQLEQTLLRCPDSASISYHPEMGYPESVNIDREVLAADEEIIYTIRNFTVIATDSVGCSGPIDGNSTDTENPTESQVPGSSMPLPPGASSAPSSITSESPSGFNEPPAPSEGSPAPSGNDDVTSGLVGNGSSSMKSRLHSASAIVALISVVWYGAT